MKKTFKNWQKSLVFLSVFVFGAAILAGVVIAATTNSNNNAPAQIVSLNETDFLVMDFNINVASDSKIAGATISAGTTITTTKPASWTDMRFYDYSGGDQWSSGSDWIGADLDGDGRYTNQADEMIYDGSYNYGGSPLVVGTPLVAIEADDKLCTDSLTTPTCIYFTDSGSGCGEDGGNADGHDTSVIVGTSACDADGDVLVTSASNWSFRDGSSTVFENDEDLFIERGGKGLTYSTGADTTTAGTGPVGGTVITATKPASWSTMSFYDASAGGQWNGSNDWIGTDADSNSYYLDRLNALTAELDGASTINAISDVVNVKFWLDNGNGSFETGSDTLLGTAATASAYDSGGSGWYVTGLNRALAGGTNRIFVSMTLNSSPSNGEIVKVYVPQYVDSGSDGVWQLGDRGMFLNSRVLGNVYNTNSMTVDAIAPTMTISLSDNELKVGDTSVFTFTFSEPVTGFTNADITTIQNGTMSPVSSSDGGTTWTSTFTPNSSIEDNSNIITVTMSGIYDVPGNPGVGTVNSANYQIDTLRPTLSSATFSDTKLKIGDTATTTFTFSEAVTGFTTADLTVPNGVISNLATADGGTVWTATLTPSGGVEDLTNEIVVNMGGVNDKKLSTDSNTGSGASNSSNYEIDTIRPIFLSATFSDNQLKIGDTATVTFSFLEEISGFTSADLTVANGSVTEPSTSDSGLTWTLTFTPSVDVEDVENLIVINMSGVNDKKLVTDSNNGAGSYDSDNYAIDTVRPVLSSITFSDDQLKDGDTATVTFNFAEKVSGFTNADLTVVNGTMTNVGSSDDGLTWTATLTPSSDTEDLTNIITVDMTGINDKRLSGDSNAGTGTVDSLNYAIDTKRPTLVSATFDDSELKIGDTSTTTFTFSEAITGFTSADLTIGNGAVSEPITTDNIIWTLTFTPNNNVEELTNAITVNMTGVNDMKLTGDSNAGLSSTASDNYAVDTIRPTLAIALDDYQLNIGATTTVTFTFSEEVVNFTNDDITTIENGTLGVISTTDNIIYTATFTPDMPVTDMTNIIAVTMSGVDDDFLPNDYNSGAGIATSSNYRIDTENVTFNIQYYRDGELTSAINGGSYLKAGTYYIKITSSEALSSAPTISIDAEGSNNDVANAATVHVSGNDYKYNRVIIEDSLAVGTTSEIIGINGYDEFDNFSDDYAPLNIDTKKVYTDTVAPVVNAGIDRGTVRATFTQTGSATDTNGSGIASYSWTKQSGHYNPSFGSASSAETTVTVDGGGPYTIKLTATDNAGNSASDTFTFTWGSVPSSGYVSSPSVGGGSSDKTVSLSEAKDIGTVGAQGTNLLTYSGSSIDFNASVSGGILPQKNILKIIEVNTINKNIKVDVYPSGASKVMTVGDVWQVDLNGDGVSDALVTYNDLLVNRVDLTVSQLQVEQVKSESDSSITEISPVVATNAVDLKAVMAREKAATVKINTKLTNRLNGRILLQVEERGQAWYIEPLTKERHFMGRAEDAFSLMRKFGLGITNANLDNFLVAKAPSKFSGRIFLAVEKNGEAYYVNPVDLKLYYLGRPADAYQMMRDLALGISNDNLRQIEVADIE